MQVVGTVFAALLGLAFGSFLNVVLARLPEEENIAWPGSHCRHCDHMLSWWENLPVLSWILLRGRCRQCQVPIGIRYPLIEISIAILWATCWLHFSREIFAVPQAENLTIPNILLHSVTQVVGYAVLCWMLVALGMLDAQHFWLPDRLTLTGIGLGFLYKLCENRSHWYFDNPVTPVRAAWGALFTGLASAGLILIIRLAYWLVRRQEGMGLGDAKLMAMLGAWLGLPVALECFVLAVLGATVTALVWLGVLALRRKTQEWARMPLPLGTFLCAAALAEIFFPSWLWLWWSGRFLGL